MKPARSTVLFGLLFAVMAFSPVLGHERHGNSNADANKSAPSSPQPNVSGAAPEDPPASEMQQEAKPVTEFPTLHPLIVHFPIMLILLAAVVQVVSFLGAGEILGRVVLALTFTGLVGAWLSSNVFHPHTTGLSDSAQRLLTEHELYAELTFWLGLAGLIAKLVSSLALKRAWWSETVTTALLIGAASAVSMAGHHGAELVHKEGVGPRGQFLEVDHDH